MNNFLISNLEKYFGYKEFRAGQEEIIAAILEKNDTLVVMPTGGGKSLCFQLPALLMQGTALVISPLIALMKDQYDVLIKKNYPVTYINSTLSNEEAKKRISNAIQGDYKLIYIAPERLTNPYFLEILSQLKISFLAVDEAHCISEWGHDFRPAYLNIANALQNINIPNIIALTATATPDVQKDIVEHLNMKKPKMLIKGFDRKNLTFVTEKIADKTGKILEILKNTKAGSTIIYCGSRKKTDEIYYSLIENGINAVKYHAGMTNEERKKNQDIFINDEVKIIVATNAFGMGIDKPDVRNVIHANLTGSIEAYYQEAGRAGRDGLPANCYLLHHYSDKKLQEFFINNSFPEKEEFVNIYDFIYLIKNFNNLANIEIANKLGISISQVTTIINHFENCGILEKLNEQKNIQMKFNYSKAEFYNYLQNTNQKNKNVLESLLRNFSEEIYFDFFEIDLLNFAKKYDLKQEEILNSLSDLDKIGIIDLKAQISANSFKLIQEKKQNIDKIGINFEKLQEQKNNSLNKLEKVIEYATTKSCKKNFILDYFNDKSYENVCGKCSSCNKIEKQNTDEIKIIVDAIFELNEKFGKYVLSQYLKGTKIDKIKQYDLNKGLNFGKLKKYDLGTINDLIDESIEYGFVNKSEGQFPILSLNRKGKLLQNPNIKSLNIDFSKKLDNFLNDFNFKKSKETKKNVNESFFENKSLALEIDNYFQKGFKIEEIASKYKMSNGLLAEIMQNAIEKSEKSFNFNNYTSKKQFENIKEIIQNRPGILLKDIQSQLSEPINFALLRIIVALVKK
jgi:ATP-dependent DNA helicase RecQ